MSWRVLQFPTSPIPYPHVLKLGGSLITSLQSGSRPELNHQLLIDCAKEIAASAQPVVVLHGTGVFGKPPALKHGYMDGHLGSGRHAVVAEVSCQLAKMEAEVLACLQEAGLHPFRLPVVSLASCTNGRLQLNKTELVSELLVRGMTPVIGGNFALDEHGFVVYSSDSIAADLAIAICAKSLVLATRAHGVYRRFGLDEEIYLHLSANDTPLIDEVDAAVHDVSGGMRKKIANGLRVAEHGIPAFIVDGRIPGNLSHAIAGHPLSGTQLRANAVATTPG
jgi:isopentenyl phosphate kinase